MVALPCIDEGGVGRPRLPDGQRHGGDDVDIRGFAGLLQGVSRAPEGQVVGADLVDLQPVDGDLLTPVGEEDDTVDAVSRALATDPPPAHLVLDLSEVEFMDSSGLRALLRIHNRHGDQIRLGPVSSVVERLLELTGTLDLFPPGEGSAPA